MNKYTMAGLGAIALIALGAFVAVPAGQMYAAEQDMATAQQRTYIQSNASANGSVSSLILGIDTEAQLRADANAEGEAYREESRSANPQGSLDAETYADTDINAAIYADAEMKAAKQAEDQSKRNILTFFAEIGEKAESSVEWGAENLIIKPYNWLTSLFVSADVQTDIQMEADANGSVQAN